MTTIRNHINIRLVVTEVLARPYCVTFIGGNISDLVNLSTEKLRCKEINRNVICSDHGLSAISIKTLSAPVMV